MATSESRLSALPRTDFGKGAARRIRRDRRVPAVIYGHGMAPVHVSLPGHETMKALKFRNGVLTIEVDGTVHTTLAKNVQRDPVRQSIDHVDLIVVRRDEQVQASIPLNTRGAGASDAIVTIEQTLVTVSAPATSLPESIEIDITGFAVGTEIHAGDLPLPPGVTLAMDPATVVIHAMPARGGAATDDAEAEV